MCFDVYVGESVMVGDEVCYFFVVEVGVDW